MIGDVITVNVELDYHQRSSVQINDSKKSIRKLDKSRIKVLLLQINKSCNNFRFSLRSIIRADYKSEPINQDFIRKLL